MFEMKKIACAILAVVCVDVTYADSVLVTQLLNQAQYWQQRGRDDLAAQSWQKLLLSEPANPDALAGLATVEAQAGHASNARTLLDKLKMADPANPKVAAVEAAVKQGKTATNSQLGEARRLAREGQTDEAVDKFKQIAEPTQLKGDAALEYYQVLSGTITGWDEARQGLERLVRENPTNSHYLLALSQHYTYRESTRREGVRILSSLSQNPAYGPQANESWRQALTWLGSTRQDIALYRQYIATHPDDAAMKQRLDDINKSVVTEHQEQVRAQAQANARVIVTNPYAKKYASAYHMLNRGDIAGAESLFTSILNSKPNDPSALGGLGIVKMHQENFVAARDLLRRAASAQRNSTWIPAYNSARYWAAVQLARKARQQGNQAEEITLLRSAIQIDDREPTALIMLADELAAGGDNIAAEANYRRVLKDHKNNSQAIFGLINVLTAVNRTEEIPALSARLSAADQEARNNNATVQANSLRLVAKAAEASGDMVKAQTAYEDALLAAPDSAWIRLDLARLYLRRGMPGQARSLVDGLLASEPDNVDALYVSALLSAELRLWWEGLMTLEHVPANKRSKELISLQNRLWMQVQMDRAVVLYQQGHREQAGLLLQRAEEVAAKEPGLLSMVADNYLRTDNLQRGLTLLRQLMVKSPKPSASLRLQYADALFRSGQDAELDPVLRQLIATPNLTADEAASLGNLYRSIVLRRVDAEREAGRLAAAYDAIQPLWAQNPQDVQLILAVARMYTSAGDYAQANNLYTQVNQIEPENKEALQAGAYSSIALHDYAGAEIRVNALLAAEPDNPRFIALAGRLARAQGNNGKALDYFHRADALERSQAATLALDARSGGKSNAADGAFGLRLVDQQATSANTATAATAFTVGSGQLAPSGPVPVQQPVVPINPFSGKPVVGSPGASGVGNETAPASKIAPLAAVVQQSVQQPLQPLQPAMATAPGAARYSNGDSSLEQEIADLQSQNKSQVGGELVVRSRTGQTGLSRLSDVETPLQLVYNTKNDGQLGLKLTPVILSAGTLNLNDTTVAGLFGRQVPINAQAIANGQTFSSVAEANGLSGVSTLNQHARGMALALSYEIRNLKIDIGTSPLGFAVNNVIGGARWTDTVGDMNVSAELSRRSVTDSYLSYAGTHDSLYGLQWGGVTKNGVRVDGSYEDDDIGMYVNSGLALLTGQNVARNSEFELGGGAYYRPYKTSDMTVTAGLNLTTFFYNKNLSYFTYGQGGYFSPQRYIALGLPADVAGRSGHLSYQVGASVGVQNFKQNDSAYFPLGSADQAALVAYAAANPSYSLATVYKGQSHTGVAYKLNGGVEYQLSPRTFIGGHFSLDNSGDFTESVGMLYWRYFFEPQTKPITFPPTPLKSYFQG